MSYKRHFFSIKYCASQSSFIDEQKQRTCCKRKLQHNQSVQWQLIAITPAVLLYIVVSDIFKYFQIFLIVMCTVIYYSISIVTTFHEISLSALRGYPFPWRFYSVIYWGGGGTEMLSIKLHFIFILGWWSCDGWLMNVGVNTCWWLNMARTSLCWPIIHVFDPNHAKTWGQHAAVTPTRR